MVNQLYIPVAVASDIEVGASAGAVVNGQEIVIWRDMSGHIHIWEDRCPHRGMKLSFGFVRDDHIACLYHGWEFGPNGQCQKIPAHPELEVPSSICTKIYGAWEVAGLIWVASDFERKASDIKDDKLVLSKSLGLPMDTDTVAIRTLYINASLANICGAIPGIFDGAATHKDAYILLETDNAKLLVGLHPVVSERSALHIVALGQPDLSTQQTVLHKMKLLRFSLEQGEVA